ncbi:hypothetical protein [Rhodococcus sp. HNM0569]|uniref:hypothetical protein n=1 Tax=Rhodococcus sp. HNM0569 TaxID=2716340 RepID=UPI00146BD7F6|nr:hypothetical protein [Rhodococcus sp. HNM0569]NLU83202.1 hypothetical protein [Rhodococcus sp. HNM0569]
MTARSRARKSRAGLPTRADAAANVLPVGCLTIASFGDAAYRPAHDLAESVRGTRVDWLRLPPAWSARSEDALGRVLHAPRGSRLALLGDGAAVGPARSLALAHGAVVDEVTVDEGDPHAYCVRCNAAHATGAAPGSLAPCPTCALDVGVYAPGSGMQAAYLALVAPS